MIDDKTKAIEDEVQKENKPKLGHLLRLWRYVFSSATAISVIYLGLYTALSLLRPLLAFMWGRYIDTAAAYLPGGALLPALALLVGYYLITFLADLIERYVSKYEDIERLEVVQTNRFKEKVNAKIFTKLSRINPEYWEVPKINDTIERTLNFASEESDDGISRGVMKQSYVVAAKLVSVASIAASLYIFSPWLCLIVVAAPLPSLYTLTLGKKLRFKFVKENTKMKREADYFQKLMLRSAVKEIKAMGLFDFFYDKWKKRMDEYTIKERRLYRSETLIDMANSVVGSLAGIGANILAIVIMAAGRITVGELGAAFSLINTLLADTGELVSATAGFAAKKNEAALFFDIMDLKESGETGGEPGTFRSIQAKNVSYRYPLTDKLVLDGVNLTINKGEKVAFVGENGAGKTTFIKLATALLSPSSGDIFINGISAAELSEGGKLGQISAVTQTPAQYKTFTAADNVYMGDTLSVRDDGRITQAMEFAGLEPEIAGLELGKDTGGTDFSGGEWQKLAIARASYRNRDFIILDEPTSNLDPLAETEVFRRYMAMARDKTVIFVTHRISVAALAERIIVFEGGQITEDGDHQTLLAKGGRYAKLYAEQAKWYDR